jgi:hypothetical protein
MVVSIYIYCLLRLTEIPIYQNSDEDNKFSLFVPYQILPPDFLRLVCEYPPQIMTGQ